jgi:hypothetical protein
MPVLRPNVAGRKAQGQPVDLDWVRERPAKRVKAEEEVKAEELEAVKVEDVPQMRQAAVSMPPLEKPCVIIRFFSFPVTGLISRNFLI